MDQQERRRIYAALSTPFPEEAIERTDGRATGKGYSTTGLKYQYVVNRLNEVLGVGGFPRLSGRFQSLMVCFANPGTASSSTPCHSSVV